MDCIGREGGTFHWLGQDVGNERLWVGTVVGDFT
jgi:hypothetical protein